MPTLLRALRREEALEQVAYSDALLYLAFVAGCAAEDARAPEVKRSFTLLHLEMSARAGVAAMGRRAWLLPS